MVPNAHLLYNFSIVLHIRIPAHLVFLILKNSMHFDTAYFTLGNLLCTVCQWFMFLRVQQNWDNLSSNSSQGQMKNGSCYFLISIGKLSFHTRFLHTYCVGRSQVTGSYSNTADRAGQAKRGVASGCYPKNQKIISLIQIN